MFLQCDLNSAAQPPARCRKPDVSLGIGKAGRRFQGLFISLGAPPNRNRDGASIRDARQAVAIATLARLLAMPREAKGDGSGAGSLAFRPAPVSENGNPPFRPKPLKLSLKQA